MGKATASGMLWRKKCWGLPAVSSRPEVVAWNELTPGQSSTVSTKPADAGLLRAYTIFSSTSLGSTKRTTEVGSEDQKCAGQEMIVEQEGADHDGHRGGPAQTADPHRVPIATANAARVRAKRPRPHWFRMAETPSTHATWAFSPVVRAACPLPNMMTTSQTVQNSIMAIMAMAVAVMKRRRIG
jgi:hypothetical protein